VNAASCTRDYRELFRIVNGEASVLSARLKGCFMNMNREQIEQTTLAVEWRLQHLARALELGATVIDDCIVFPGSLAQQRTLSDRLNLEIPPLKMD
jgi:hypothetical protein